MSWWVRSLVWVIQQLTCPDGRRAAHERHHRTRIVTRLLDHLRIVERAAVDARRRAGLEPPDDERALAQLRGQRGRRRIAHAARGVLGFADVDLAGQEGAAVSTTAGASKRRPVLVITPRTHRGRPPGRRRPAWNTVRFGWCSTAWRMKARYSARSAWQRVARTAGPLLAFSVRHWMPAASAAAPSPRPARRSP
jgi:hypothetical protein